MKTAVIGADSEYAREVIPSEHHPILRTIKYSGNKTRLLPVIVSIVKQVVKPGGKILDLMAGTHCVGYALKSLYEISANDIQEYSYVIGKAYIENGGYSVNRGLAESELTSGIVENNRTARFDLFQKTYANTYFTNSQCVEIDNVKAAIDKVPSPRRELYLSALMSAMCYASNSAGHFAEFLNKRQTNPRSIQELFFRKCENASVLPSCHNNKVFNADYMDFLNDRDPKLTSIVEDCDLIYLDPPYSSAQYSRFYHILETLVKYDFPVVEHKGLYRNDRYFSPFCRKSEAMVELDFALEKCSEVSNGFVLLSYVDSSSCLIDRDDFESIVRSHFSYVTRPFTFELNHSKLGNGICKKVTEYLILATNSVSNASIVKKLRIS